MCEHSLQHSSHPEWNGIYACICHAGLLCVHIYSTPAALMHLFSLFVHILTKTCTFLISPLFSNFSLISTDLLLLFHSNHFESSALQMSVCVVSCSWHSSVVLLMFQTIWRLASAPSHGAIEEDCRDSHDLIPSNLIAIQSSSKWQGNHPKVFLRVRVGTYKKQEFQQTWKWLILHIKYLGQ